MAPAMYIYIISTPPHKGWRMYIFVFDVCNRSFCILIYIYPTGRHRFTPDVVVSAISRALRFIFSCPFLTHLLQRTRFGTLFI
jgi:hypothetical protein